mgnify:CR=1 FL=1
MNNRKQLRCVDYTVYFHIARIEILIVNGWIKVILETDKSQVIAMAQSELIRKKKENGHDKAASETNVKRVTNSSSFFSKLRLKRLILFLAFLLVAKNSLSSIHLQCRYEWSLYLTRYCVFLVSPSMISFFHRIWSTSG